MIIIQFSLCTWRRDSLPSPTFLPPFFKHQTARAMTSTTARTINRVYHHFHELSEL